jgi:hypothetical protein
VCGTRFSLTQSATDAKNEREKGEGLVMYGKGNQGYSEVPGKTGFFTGQGQMTLRRDFNFTSTTHDG